MVRRVSAAGRVVDHEWPVGLYLIQHLDASNRLVSHRGDQIPAGMTKIGFDRRSIAEQIVRLPLVGVVADETKIIVKALDGTGWPVGEWASLARHPLRCVVILAVPRGVVAVLPQDLADSDSVSLDHAVISGEAGRLIYNDAGGHRMMVAAGEQGSARRRAERRGVEPGVAQAHLSDAVQRGRR